jgi:hypothetical protein
MAPPKKKTKIILEENVSEQVEDDKIDESSSKTLAGIKPVYWF